MITLKVQKKDELTYLVGLEEVDLQDLNKQDAIISFKLGDTKVSLIKVNGSKEDFLSHIKTLGGLNEESRIIKP